MRSWLEAKHFDQQRCFSIFLAGAASALACLGTVFLIKESMTSAWDEALVLLAGILLVPALLVAAGAYLCLIILRLG